MDFAFSGIVIVALLIYAYCLCVFLGDQPARKAEASGASAFPRLETTVWYCSLLGIVMIVASVTWLLVITYVAGG